MGKEMVKNLRGRKNRDYLPHRMGDQLPHDMRGRFLDSIPTSLFQPGSNVNLQSRERTLQTEQNWETEESAVIAPANMYVQNPQIRRITEAALKRVNYAPMLQKWEDRNSKLDQQPILQKGGSWLTSDSASGAPFTPYNDGGDLRHNNLGLFAAAKSGFGKNRGLSVLRSVFMGPINKGREVYVDPRKDPSSFENAIRSSVAEYTGFSERQVSELVQWGTDTALNDVLPALLALASGHIVSAGEVMISYPALTVAGGAAVMKLAEILGTLGVTRPAFEKALRTNPETKAQADDVLKAVAETAYDIQQQKMIREQKQADGPSETTEETKREAQVNEQTQTIWNWFTGGVTAGVNKMQEILAGGRARGPQPFKGSAKLELEDSEVSKTDTPKAEIEGKDVQTDTAEVTQELNQSVARIESEKPIQEFKEDMEMKAGDTGTMSQPPTTAPTIQKSVEWLTDNADTIKRMGQVTWENLPSIQFQSVDWAEKKKQAIYERENPLYGPYEDTLKDQLARSFQAGSESISSGLADMKQAAQAKFTGYAQEGLESLVKTVLKGTTPRESEQGPIYQRGRPAMDQGVLKQIAPDEGSVKFVNNFDIPVVVRQQQRAPTPAPYKISLTPRRSNAPTMQKLEKAINLPGLFTGYLDSTGVWEPARREVLA